MGEAKRKKELLKEAAKHSKPISRARFNLYSIGTRLARSAGLCEEMAWWALNDESLIGMVGRDTVDDDYLWMILARDRNGRFRCASLDCSISTREKAEADLKVALFEAAKRGDIEEFGAQGDETNHPIDLFELPLDHDPEKLHPYFRLLLEDDSKAPAKAVLKELGPWLTPSDPHLVGEFQGNGFDQRLWEFYLWATFKEFFLDVEQLEAPDFLCTAPGIGFTVEATTVGPSNTGALADHPNPQNEEEREKFLADYMPMKFGSALTGKLNKKNRQGEHYWEREKAKGLPFTIAIADFHKAAGPKEPASMVYTQSALWQYLYGKRVRITEEGGIVAVKEVDVEKHVYNGKEIPSGFFDLENAENVSAVIFSNAGTIAKFDRMGTQAGFAKEGYTYYRHGLMINPDPDATMGIPFVSHVNADDYEEWWTQEVIVFHNPNAKIPLPPEFLLGASHYLFKEDDLLSIVPNDAVLNSITMIMKSA